MPESPLTVTGDSRLQVIYGRAPRTAYPDTLTHCLSGLTLADDDRLLAVDECVGFLLELQRR